MFRNLNEDSHGNINNGFTPNDASPHAIIEPPRMTISRSVYNQKNLNDEMIYNKNAKSPSTGGFTARSCWSFVLKTFPFLSWIYNYKREYLVGDLISGATVCSLHIPGLGHAMLGINQNKQNNIPKVYLFSI